ncbi:MAG: DUF1345 domain-containing protein [Terricaulis sp.]
MAMPLSTELRAVFLNRPLRWALILGAAAAVAMAYVPGPLTTLTRALIAWDLGLLAYISVLVHKMRGIEPEAIAKHSAENDEGRFFILIASLIAVSISLAVIIAEAAEAAVGSKVVHVAFVFVTVAISWLFVHTMFAAHYTHEFYGPDDDGKGTRRGLMFPGCDAPDFWDFWHFALVIGVANQTADVQITSQSIRRIVTLHGIIAFVFNTVILALTINQAAGLFPG